MAEHILFYGSLRREFGIAQQLNIGPYVDFIAMYHITGTLYDFGQYPGLVLSGSGTVVCELSAIRSSDLFSILDPYEGFVQQSPEQSLFIRKRIYLPSKIAAWVYEYNHAIEDAPIIPNGDWLSYQIGTM